MWEQVFVTLKERGVKEIGLVICDGLSGIETAISKIFPMAEIQLCIVHLERNILKQVRPKDRSSVATDFKEVFRVGDRYDTQEKGWERWRSFCKKWGEYYKGIKRMAENDRYRLYFTYLCYDYRIHNMIYTTNWIERLNRSYKRTIRMRGALPNPEATILLLGYVAMTRDEYQRKLPKLNYETKKLHWSE